MSNDDNATAPPSRFRAFTAEVTHTDAGDPKIHLRPTGYARRGPRTLAIFTYEVTAELERRSELLNASWVIVPHVRTGHVVIELRAENDHRAASSMVNEALEALDIL